MSVPGWPAGWRLDHRACTRSTNADALQAARAGAPQGLVVLADEQTAGRGRQGRSWSAEPGASLTVSVLRRPPVPPAEAFRWTLLAGWAAWRALAPRWPVWLKWPNDLYADERKVAGVLGELDESTGLAVVVGMGLNLSSPRAGWPEELADRATALAAVGPQPDRDGVLADWLRAFAEGEERLLRDGPPALIEGCRQAMAPLWGRRVGIDGGQRWRGRAEGLHDSGALLVVDDAGRTHRVLAGDVHIGAL